MQTTLNRLRNGPPVPEEARRVGRRQHRGRVALLGGLATFVLIQIGLRLLIDFYYPAFRDPRFATKASQLKHLISCCPSPPRTVITLGSSVTYHAYQAKLLEEILAGEEVDPSVVYNMADGAGSPLTGYLYLHRLLRKNVHLDLVLIEVSPLIFNETEGSSDLGRFPPFRLDEQDLEIVARYSKDARLKREWRLAQIVPSFGQRLPIINCLAPVLVPSGDRLHLWNQFDDHGWTGKPPSPQKELQEIVAKVQNNLKPTLQKFSPGPVPLKGLQELLALLKNEGIPCALVKMPLGPALRGLCSPAGIEKLDQALAEISRKYDCPFLDAYFWLEEEMFLDGYHTNTQGADRFTRRVALELVVPMLTKKNPQTQARNSEPLIIPH